MKIAPYELSFQGNSLKGILLEEEGAYSLLQPWPELGDNPLEDYWHDLKTEKKLPLTQRALELLDLEKTAKSQKVLLKAKELPLSHSQLQVGDALKESPVLKLKIGRNLESEMAYLQKLEETRNPFRLRLDANLKFNREEAFQFFSRLSEKTLCRIDFVEDPIRGTEKDWEALSKNFDLRVAHDFAPESFREVSAVWILKPSRINPWSFVERAAHEMIRIVVTNALDHPLGHLVTAWESSRILELHPLLIDTCALNSEIVPNIEKLLATQSGFGFGMDSTLKGLEWELLS